jgi:hypothetical protein
MPQGSTKDFKVGLTLEMDGYVPGRGIRHEADKHVGSPVLVQREDADDRVLQCPDVTIHGTGAVDNDNMVPDTLFPGRGRLHRAARDVIGHPERPVKTVQIEPRTT